MSGEGSLYHTSFKLTTLAYDVKRMKKRRENKERWPDDNENRESHSFVCRGNISYIISKEVSPFKRVDRGSSGNVVAIIHIILFDSMRNP